MFQFIHRIPSLINILIRKKKLKYVLKGLYVKGSLVKSKTSHIKVNPISNFLKVKEVGNPNLVPNSPGCAHLFLCTYVSWKTECSK